MAIANKKIDIMENITDEDFTLIPAVALRGIVIFPNDVVHFDVGRTISINAVNAAIEQNRTVFLVPQMDIGVEDPKEKDVYNIGVIAKIRQVLKISDDGVRVLVEGICRGKLRHFEILNETSFATVSPLEDKVSRAKSAYKEALIRKIREAFAQFSQFLPKMPKDIKNTIMTSNDIGYLGDYIAANLPVPVDDKQYVLEKQNPVKRLEVVLDIIKRELEICQIDASINEKTRKNIEENQKEYYLREQLRVINGELYGEDNPDNEIEDYLEKINSLKAEEKVKEILKSEVNKLSKMPAGSHEATVIRVYLDTCLALPFGIKTKTNGDVKKAEKILERDHFGLKKVKEQILETISVLSLKPDAKGNIICLSGPPGVGKTSIAKSLAESMGRNFQRISLGGIHDEAEIRGHRKTYIGAMVGKIIKAVTDAGSTNALILLDEIDKLTSDYKGDPASALLEVLDSEQNSTFVDHYIDFPFDLSDIFFVTTANNCQNIPAPLLDRMDVIEIPGYTREEKFEIAKRHLVKKQTIKHGLTSKIFKIDDEVIKNLIDFYTREAGVRKLERKIAGLCRKAAKKIAEGETKVRVTTKNLTDFLGKHKYSSTDILQNSEVGIINGLAWTSVGGEVMQMEVLVVEGTGKIELTGSLGDVMKESAVAAVTWVRANAEKYNIDTEFYKNKDIHIHATESAVPKDGPSAGVTIATGLISALSETPIKNTVAMTGEITIRGRVLPIGGLIEKSMAAYTAGIKTVIIPKKNEADLQEISPTVLGEIEFVPVESIEQVLEIALDKAKDFTVHSEKIPCVYKDKISEPILKRT